MKAPTLFVFGGGIGDFILTWPALRRLSQDGPVDLLGDSERLGLAVNGGLARAMYTFEETKFHTIFSEIDPRLREFLAHYQRAILWLGADDDLPARIKDCGVEDVESHPGKPPANWTRHASEYYCERLRIPDPGPVHISIEEATPTHDIVLHPGSGSPTKNWPMPNFLALADALLREGRKVEWIQGPAEKEHNFLEAAVNTIHTGSLEDIARLLASATLYIGNDSGITHLAAAVGCPTIALFGPTDPTVWAPRGDHVTVLEGHPWPCLPEVLSAISSQ